jgi:periplasmic protein TonB
MDFARQQRDPTRHLVGITIVVLVHVFVIYALMTGLVRKGIEVVKKPLSATIIEEVKLPPPPPPPPPKQAPKPPPPPEYVPPPDIPVQTISPSPNAITAVTSAPPEPKVVEAPPAPPPPPPPPKPAVRRGAQLTIINKEEMNYPREAIRRGVEKGTVVARLQIDEKGVVTEVQIISSEPRGVFDSEVKRALMLWRFKPEGEKYVGEVEINFALKEE